MAVQPVVTIQPGMVLAPVDMKINSWSSGICDCCEDMGICCCAFWCFPCFMCKTASEFGECLCLPLLDPCSPVPPISLAVRSSIRERYRIKGSICSDCCTVTCCNACAWCQMAREMKRHKQPLILTAPTTMPAVQPMGNYPSAPPSGLYPPMP
ncbi:cornifelin homolog A-like [Lepisosteus oculatus]|nr:PREDICTED: cornifelin homolog A-like [Lepisosteus oculatus]XP_015195922.1 PREDICTED: cornifelin homolog A-like [Lepisosteus oculatus]XP_015195923.1 PREDICTED: cornifelin homolog A-like [Lepisosteus oculatus]XP_015195924.1 PREDICTED: cornifelin homolog A-like [Lepisosteus oculatus]